MGVEKEMQKMKVKNLEELTENEIVEMMTKLKPRTLRVIKYLGHEHNCSKSSLQVCFTCHFKGCKECYIKHIREFHAGGLSKLETLYNSALIVAKTNEEDATHLAKCPICNIYTSVEGYTSHLKNKHSETTRRMVPQEELQKKVKVTKHTQGEHSSHWDKQIKSLTKSELKELVKRIKQEQSSCAMEE